MPSAYRVPRASDVLPEPDTPTTATVRHNGTSTSTSRRLLCRAPRTTMAPGSVGGTRPGAAFIVAPYAGGLPQPPGPVASGPGASGSAAVRGEPARSGPCPGAATA